jgi:hypothetical protein
MHTTIKQIMRRGGVVGDDDKDGDIHNDDDDENNDNDNDGGCSGRDGHHRMRKGRGHNDTTIKRSQKRGGRRW